MQMIVVEQIRGARAMLGIKQGDLAKHAGISVSTLNNIERGVQTDPKISTMRAIQHALEQKGIEFSSGEGGRIGLSMRMARQGDQDGGLRKTGRADGDGAYGQTAARPGSDVLLIDDQADDRDLVKGWLRQRHGAHLRVTEAATARDGYVALKQDRPRLVLLTDRMYGVHGLHFLADLQRDKLTLPTMIVVTVNEDPAVERALRAQGVERIVPRKELTRERLFALLDSVPLAQAA